MNKALFIARHFRLFFWITLVITLIPVTIMIGHRQYLKGPASPQGIISMELAASDSNACKIAQSWNDSTINTKLNSYCSCDSDVYAYRDTVRKSASGTLVPKIARLQVARTDIYWDFLFIFLYVFLAIVVICGLESGNTDGGFLLRFMIGIAVVAGIGDFIEDFGMLSYLNTDAKSMSVFAEPVYSIASLIKFILLGALLILYIPWRIYKKGILGILSGYITTKLFQAWRYRVVLGGILLFSLPLWISDQGQDLLINISGSVVGVLVYLTILTLSAFLNWWLAKLFFENAYQPPVLPYIEPAIQADQLAIEKKASRFLGVLTFLSPACAMLQTLTNFKIHYVAGFLPPVLWLVTLISIFYLVIKFDVIDKWYQSSASIRQRRRTTLLGAVVLLVVLIMIVPLFMWKSDLGRSPLSLTYISLDLVLLAFVFLVTVTLRNYLVPQKWLWLREKIGIPIYIGAVAACVCFLTYNALPLWTSKIASWNFFCLPVLFCGFVFYTVLFTLLLRLGKWKHINFAGLFFLICLLINISAPNKYHDVRFRKMTSDSLYSSRVSLDEYFAGWVWHRRQEIDTLSDRCYPVFIVNAYGGGIRASAYTSLVINHLNQAVEKWYSDSQPFEHFVFSYSGASGGTIGLAQMCAYRWGSMQNNMDHQADSLTADQLIAFYNQDFLTSLIACGIGRDVWAASSGTSFWSDRSAIQESLWEYRVHMSWANVSFGRDFYSYWDTTDTPTAFEVPLLFSNSCNVDDGLKGIMSPVRLDHSQFPATDFIADQIPPGKMIPLSTAAFLSARFPLLSPAGKTNDNFHFVDGGLKENSGAETSENIYLALKNFLADTVSLKRKHADVYPYLKKIGFYLISIANSSHSRSGPDKKVKVLFQLTSPLIGLYNSGVDGNSHKADSTLRNRYPTIYASLWPDVDCINMELDSNKKNMFSPALPLGWQISVVALNRLDQGAMVPSSDRYMGDSLPAFSKIKQFFMRSAIKKP